MPEVFNVSIALEVPEPVVREFRAADPQSPTFKLLTTSLVVALRILKSLEGREALQEVARGYSHVANDTTPGSQAATADPDAVEDFLQKLSRGFPTLFLQILDEDTPSSYTWNQPRPWSLYNYPRPHVIYPNPARVRDMASSKKLEEIHVFQFMFMTSFVRHFGSMFLAFFMQRAEPDTESPPLTEEQGLNMVKELARMDRELCLGNHGAGIYAAIEDPAVRQMVHAGKELEVRVFGGSVELMHDSLRTRHQPGIPHLRFNGSDPPRKISKGSIEQCFTSGIVLPLNTTGPPTTKSPWSTRVPLPPENSPHVNLLVESEYLVHVSEEVFRGQTVVVDD